MNIFDLVRQKKNPIAEDVVVEESLPEQRTSSIFDAVRQSKSQQSEQSQQQEPEIPQLQEDFEEWSDEKLERETDRNKARNLSLIGSTVLGLPGDLIAFGRGLFGLETDIPGSADIQKGFEKLSGGYLEPQNDLEKKSDELMKDIYGMSQGGRPTLVRNIGIPIAANLFKEGIKGVGGEEKEATYAKIGAMTLLDLLHGRQTKGMGGARKFASDLYNQADAALPQGATISAGGLEKNLKALKKELTSGGTAPSKANAITKVDEILGSISKGRVDVKRLTDFRQTINELINSRGGFDILQPKSVQQKSIYNLNKVKENVIDSINDYGKMNTKFGQLDKAANEAYAAYSASNHISNFLKSHEDKIQSKTLKTALGLGGLSGGYMFPTAGVAGAGISAAALPVYEAVKITQRMYQSPTLRQYYNGLIRDALTGNTVQAIKNLEALDKHMQAEDKKKEDRIRQLKKEV